MKACD